MGSPIFISRLKHLINASDLNSALSSALGINPVLFYLRRRHAVLETVGQCLRQILLLGKDLLGKVSFCPLGWQICICWNEKLPCVGHALLIASKKAWTWPMALGLVCTSVLSSSSVIWKGYSPSPTLLLLIGAATAAPCCVLYTPDLPTEPLIWDEYCLACLSQSQ